MNEIISPANTTVTPRSSSLGTFRGKRRSLPRNLLIAARRDSCIRRGLKIILALIAFDVRREIHQFTIIY